MDASFKPGYINVSLEFSSTKWAKLPFFVIKIILSSGLGVTLFPDDYCSNLLHWSLTSFSLVAFVDWAGGLCFISEQSQKAD